MAFRIRQLAILLISALVFQACNDGTDSVTTTPTAGSSLTLNMDQSTLKFENKGFSILTKASASGPYSITQKGISFSTTRFQKLLAGQFTQEGAGNGDFTARISGLEFAETWYLRPYAITVDANQKVDTTYGSDLALISTPTIKSIQTTDLSETGFTLASTGLKANSITGLGNILSKGFCWSTSLNPDLRNASKWFSDQADTAAFSYSLTNLETDKVYYVRAFAINEADTTYSANLMVGTSIRDIQNNIYSVCVVGNQVWMRENLRTKQFRDGTALVVAGPDTWKANQNQASSSPTNSIYGNYYNQLAMADPRGLCPAGWRMPEKLDWDTLLANLGGWNVAGLKMKAPTSAWGGSLTGQGSSQFNAIPSGRIDSAGTVRNQGELGYWWARKNTVQATPERIFRIDKYNDEVLSGQADSAFGYTVRCVRNVK
jgi:uncharacterized protein (TIGR02145 family)